LSDSKRILVVEDHDDVARVVSLLLGGEGHVVETAPTARCAMTAVTSFAPHIVLIDIVLPDLTGDLLAERLRIDHAHAALRLVGMTGARRNLVRREIFDAWLDKPFTLEQLVHAVVPRPS
jgi:CheY-like chemotaxis protein